MNRLDRKPCLKSLSVLTGIVMLLGGGGSSHGRGVGNGVATGCAQAATASLSGTIVDQTGAVVPDASVVVINTDTGLQRRAVTNSEGYFSFLLIQPGNYSLTAEMPGFVTVTVDDIVLRVNFNTNLDIVLSPKGISEAISVSADSSVGATGNHVDISGASMKYSVNNRQVVGLPVWSTSLGRNGLGMLPFLLPGISPTTVSGSASSLVNRLGDQMSINGSRPSSISFNLEGGDNNDYELNRASSQLPNPDVLQEFTVTTNNYGADQGRSSGGIIDAVIKSGTAKYRGNARYFLINEALNARGFFDSRVPIDRLSTFGGQIGGPVKLPRLHDERGGTFFFIDYEGTRYRTESSSNLSVLTKREREGDFSGRLLFDPSRKFKLFPGGIIPPERISPIARAYIERYIPLPNDGERNFRQLLLSQSQNDQISARADRRIGDADSLSLMFFWTSSAVLSGNSFLPAGSKTDSRADNKNLVLRETHSFSDHAINQFTWTLTGFYNNRSSISPGATGVRPSELGFTGIRPQTARFPSAPAISIASTDVRMDSSSPSSATRTTWQIKDDFSYLRAGHAFKFGEEVRGFTQSSVIGNNNGSFSFSNVYTGNAIADFLLGLPFKYSQTTGSEIFPRQRAYYSYAMDDWRLRPNLTINIGLRYELAPPLTDNLDQVSVFRPGQISKQFPRAPVGLLFPGDPDPVLGTVPRGAYPTDKNNFAPRLGVAYSPKPESGWLRTLFGGGKTALRAGWGVFYDQTIGESFTRFSFVQPFSVSQGLNSFQINRAGGNFANPFGSIPNPWPFDLSKRAFTGTPQVLTLDPGFRTAYSYQGNVTIQRELPWSLLVEAAYVATWGFKLNRSRELNLATLQLGATMFNIPSRRTYRNLDSVISQESTGRSRYDSLQLRITRRPSRGLTLDGSYVLGKALDEGSTPLPGLYSNQFRWARSAFDRRHNFVMSYTYELPSTGFPGLLRQVFNGWQIGGITELRSGMPMDIRQFWDSTLTGQAVFGAGNPDFVGPYVPLDPRKYRTIVVNGVPRSGNFFFDPNAFHTVTVNDYTQARPGTLGRNVFDGPGINLWSLSVIKRIPITESKRLVLRCDIRNLFNNPQFETPQLLVDASDQFGRVTAAAPGRNIQLSLRYSF